MTAPRGDEHSYNAKKAALLDLMQDSVEALTELAEARRQAKVRLHDLAGGPAADGPSLPRTPVVQSSLLTDNNALAEKAAAWIAREMKRTGRKPPWKQALLAVSRQSQASGPDDADGQSMTEPKAGYAELKSELLAAESPVASTQQPKPASIQKAIATATTQSTAGPLTSGYRWSPAGGWTLEQADPWTNAREAALATAARIPAAAPDQRRTDVQSPSMRLAEVAHDRMAMKGQSVDPKSKNYLSHFRCALLEVAEP